MSSVKIRSHKVEQEQNAEYTSYALPESLLKAKEVFESCKASSERPHGFSTLVAARRREKPGSPSQQSQKLGDTSAVVLRYLASKQRTDGKLYGGKRRVRINLDHIAAQYSYMGRSTVDESIGRLIEFGACEVENWNIADGRASYDRTRWFHVPKAWSDLAEKEIRYFYPSLAAVIGIPASAIHHNFTHWIDDRTRAEEVAHVYLKPADLTTRLPYSKSTIKRAIGDLGLAKMLFPVPENQCLYAAEEQNGTSSNPDETSSKPDKVGSIPDQTSSKPDNNSICKNFEESLEESSKTPPQAASAHSPYVEDAHSTSAHQGIPFPAAQHTAKAFSPFEEVLSRSQQSFAPIHNLPELHEINHQHDLLAKDCEAAAGGKEKLTDIVHDLCQRFLSTVDEAMLDEVYEHGTDDEAFDLITPRFVEWYQRTYRSNNSTLELVVCYGSLECLIGALVRSRYGDKLLHPITMFRRVSYGIYLQLWNRAESRREAAVQEEFSERNKEFQSIDILKEHDDSLSPAEKTRVFKQGLHSMNKVGWLKLGDGHAIGEIVISSTALKTIERFFDLNEHLTPWFLLDVMRECLKIHESYPAPPKKYRKGCRWHARMAHHLSIFARCLPHVLSDLKRSTDGIVFSKEQDRVYEELEVAE